ncbi:MAG: SDR family oxidoreductase [Actinobacteria bacterium]|nr:MAG: SDR family oxidoreductase [Actinomycetota bacterium]
MDSSAGSLRGKRALVTGASRGIGRDIALYFARAGADVAIAARNEEALLELQGEIEALRRTCVVITADVTQEGAAASIVECTERGLGGLDILVNNAGGSSFSVALQSMNFSGWQKTMMLNVDSIVLLIQAALPALIRSGNASIINVSSVAGLRGAPLMSHYGAAKAALISLTQSLAIEVATQGVRVNALIPGWIETDLTDFLRTEDSVEQSVLSQVPMGRWGRSDEIAEGALFLASDASSFMTGQLLILDGGLSARP